MKSKSVFDIFTCRYYTELVSKEIDQKLTLKEKIFYLFHHVICTFCRRSRRQFYLIDRALKKQLEVCEHIQHVESEAELEFQMPDSAKSRIKMKIDEIL